MSIEKYVHDEFAERLQQVATPPIDPTALVRRGRGRRRRRHVVAVASGVAGVVAVVGGLQLAASEGRDRGNGDLPVVTAGAVGPQAIDAPTRVFYTDSRVWIDGTSYPAGNFATSTGPHIGQLGVAYPADKSGRPHLMRRDGTQVPLAPATPAYGEKYNGWIAADALSPLVAWAERKGTTVDLVAFDTATMSVIGHRRLECDQREVPAGSGWDGVECPSPYVADSGVVFVHQRARTFGWRPADDAWLPLGRGTVSAAHGKTVSFFAGERPADLGVLGAGWRVLEVRGEHWEDAAKQGDIEALVSFDGSWVTDASGLRVEKWTDPEQTVTFDPPGDVVASQYDPDGSVLFVTRTGDVNRVWDCTVEEGCEDISGGLPEEVLLVAWDS